MIQCTCAYCKVGPHFPTPVPFSSAHWLPLLDLYTIQSVCLARCSGSNAELFRCSCTHYGLISTGFVHTCLLLQIECYGTSLGHLGFPVINNWDTQVRQGCFVTLFLTVFATDILWIFCSSIGWTDGPDSCCQTSDIQSQAWWNWDCEGTTGCWGRYEPPGEGEQAYLSA